jgi:predicted DNA binding protein
MGKMTGTIVDVGIPADQFALKHTLDVLQTVTFEVEQMVATHQDCLMPYIWIGTTDRARLEEALTADESVADFHLIAEFDTDCLYQLEWVERTEHLIRILVDQKATVLTATGQEDTWHLRLLFADHDTISHTNKYCEENGIEFEVENIHEFNDNRGSRFGLTDTQQTALNLAAARGYYSIPRDVSAEDLAAEIGVSHQALSEQLRRGHGNLINHILVGGVGTPKAPEPEQTEEEREIGTD